MNWRGLGAALYTIARGRNRIRWFSPTVFFVGTSFLVYSRYHKLVVHAAQKKTGISRYEKQFRDFASVTYNGVVFMTPKDFLDSLIKDWPENLHLTSLSKKDVDSMLRKTPPVAEGSENLFRNLGASGLISFTEYLFLLQILTKPHSSFEIAFKMLDTDMSGAVDAQEFLTLNYILTHSRSTELLQNETTDLVSTSGEEIDTTLMEHLFGKKRERVLKLNDFVRFMRNIQTESLIVEFRSRAVGSETISATEFARILLRYTTISSEEYEEFIQRLHRRLKQPTEITFSEFQKFFNFLNALDDFALAMKMYTLAERPISLPEFNRAVKACTGYALDLPVLRVVFELFDADGDGCLSYQEFLNIMHERRSRRIQGNSQVSTRVEAYRQCVAKRIRETVTG